MADGDESSVGSIGAGVSVCGVNVATGEPGAGCKSGAVTGVAGVLATAVGGWLAAEAAGSLIEHPVTSAIDRTIIAAVVRFLFVIIGRVASYPSE